MIYEIPDWAHQLYESLHAAPELGFAEHRTSSAAADVLDRTGFEVHRGIGGTGIAALLDLGDGPTVAARAELDALPLTERTGASFASRANGVMHACGHDLHLVALLAAAAQIADQAASPARNGPIAGKVVLLLQPAEELGRGAAAMVEDRLLERIPRPDLLLAQHVSPMAPVGVLASTPGTSLAASDVIRVRIRSTGGHASSPDNGVDPVLTAANLVQKLHTIVGRDVAPFDQAVVTVPSIEAPSAPGLRAPEALVTITVRTLADHVRSKILERIRSLVRAEALAADLEVHETESRVDGSVDFDGPGVFYERAPAVPHVVNDPSLLRTVVAAHHRQLSVRHLTVPPALASDDFSNLAAAFGCPSAYWFVGSGSPLGRLGPVRPACHTDLYLPHPSTLPLATAVMRETVLAALRGQVHGVPDGEA